MELFNEMEAIVYSMVDEIIARDAHISKCEKCRMDVVALALNYLPPRYTVSAKGQVFSKVDILNQQFGTDVVSAITRAMIKVSAAPQHD
jgi:competence protein ComFB